MSAEGLIEEFNSLKSDVEKWQWVMQNQDKDILVNLDNDDTYITIEGEESYGQFGGYVGWSDGVFDLLEAIGVKAEGV